MNRSNSQEYSTSDLGLAAFLICSEAKLRDIDRTNPRRAVFIFNDCKPDVVRGWQSGRGQVSGLAYYNALQTLKGELWRER
jgi:hypothetical protein